LKAALELVSWDFGVGLTKEQRSSAAPIYTVKWAVHKRVGPQPTELPSALVEGMGGISALGRCLYLTEVLELELVVCEEFDSILGGGFWNPKLSKVVVLKSGITIFALWELRWCWNIDLWQYFKLDAEFRLRARVYCFLLPTHLGNLTFLWQGELVVGLFCLYGDGMIRASEDLKESGL
jgi:hypothetical protein